MKKALKILLWTIAGILALVLVLLLTIPLWLGPTVTVVANKVTPEYTGTPFSLGGVGINPYSGKYRITSLDLGNPKGYPVPTAFSVSNVLVDVEMTSLFSDTIHIREITIESPYVSYVSKDGTNNFEWIAANATAKMGPKDETKKEKKTEEEKGPGKKVVIDKLTLAGACIKVKMLPEISIPTITLTDIGKENGGATWAEVGQALMDAIKNAGSAISEGLTTALGALGDGAGVVISGATNVLSGAASALGDGAGAVLSGTTNVLGGAASALGDGAGAVLSGTTNVLGGAASALGEGASKAVGSIGSIFGGDKKSGDEKKAEPEKKDGAGKKDDAEKKDETSKGDNGAKGTGKSAAESLKDAGKTIGEGAVNTGKAIGEGAKDAFKKVGNLFGN